MQHRISAGVLVEQEGSVLLVRSVLPERYDFWVAPGGGVQGAEDLATAARREAREETGLHVSIDRLLYIEELLQPGLRTCKFWFAGRVEGGVLSVAAPEAAAEHITEAAWLSREHMEGKNVFPRVLLSRYWSDRHNVQAAPVHLGISVMESV